METIGRSCPHDATSLDFPAETYRLTRDLKDIKIGIPSRFLENLKTGSAEQISTSASMSCKFSGRNSCRDRSRHPQIFDRGLLYSRDGRSLDQSRPLRRDPLRSQISKQAKKLEQIYDFSRKEGFGREVKKRIMLGTYVLSAGFQDAYYKKAQKVRSLILDAFENAFEICDAVDHACRNFRRFRSSGPSTIRSRCTCKIFSPSQPTSPASRHQRSFWI